jgi:hypothetical protein
VCREHFRPLGEELVLAAAPCGLVGIVVLLLQGATPGAAAVTAFAGVFMAERRGI